MFMKILKSFMILISFFLLTSCSLSNITEKQKLVNYLEKNKEYEKHKDKYVLNMDGDFYSNQAYYFKNEVSYSYYTIDINNLKYSFENKYYYSSTYENSIYNSVVHIEYEYNPLTNISNGSYILNTYSEGSEIATIHREYSYMYDYNTGTNECAYKASLISQSEKCVINADSYGKQFLKLKEDYLTLLKSANVSEQKFYDELKK